MPNKKLMLNQETLWRLTGSLGTDDDGSEEFESSVCNPTITGINCSGRACLPLTV
jgi:hypothetical protein